jgi:hypothetical protein
MERGHDIKSEEIAVKSITIGSIHRPDLKTLSKEEATQFIITIGHFMCGVPPKTAGIENIGSGQDQPPTSME